MALESASWTRTNRRSFAVVEALGERTGTGLIGAVPGGNVTLEELNEPQQATAIAEAGLHLLNLSIATATNPGGARVRNPRKWRALNRVNAALNGSNGIRAAVFLAHALSRVAEVAGFDCERQAHVRELLFKYFPSSPEDQAAVEDYVRAVEAGQIDQREAYVELSFHALAHVVGDAARELPAFRDSGDWINAHAASLSFQIAWKHANTAYLELTDPEAIEWRSR